MDKVHLIIVIVLGVVGLVLGIVGFVTAGWMIKHYQYNSEYYGLWYLINCYTAFKENRCETVSHADVRNLNIDDELNRKAWISSEVLASIGLCASIAGFVMILVSICWKRFATLIRALALAIFAISGLFTVIPAGIWARRSIAYLNLDSLKKTYAMEVSIPYSVICSIFAAIIAFVIAIILLVVLCKDRQQQSREKNKSIPMTRY
ncbi:hypothetical protein ScPMuIL_005144 [Solemya velum]